MSKLKAALKSNQLTIGSWITLAHPAIAEIMANAGFDWLTVDLEHSVITIREAKDLIRVSTLCGVPALVRLTDNDPNQIKRVMDAGASGIIVPMVSSAAEAKAAVAAMHYPPKGNRGVGLARAHGYGATFEEYRKWLFEESVCIAQIENISAVENIEEILSVEGVDGYILGPYDLSASMGLIGQLDHPDVLKATKDVLLAGLELNVPGGLHVVEPDIEKLEANIKLGFKFLAYSLDTRMIDTVCRTGLQRIKRA